MTDRVQAISIGPLQTWNEFSLLKAMDLRPKFLLTVLAVTLCFGCEARPRVCGYLSDGYKNILGHAIYDLAPYAPEDLEPSILSDIQKCWAEMPYGGDQKYTLEFIEARLVSPTQYYLVFEPRGITDVRLAFLVDDKEDIVGAYQYSLL